MCPSQRYDRTKVTKNVIHHLGDGLGPAVTAGELRKRANPPQPGYPAGYEFPEYDYGILADGTIIEMRPLTVIGAHSQADKPPYILGPNWWNLNSASVVIGIDATLYIPPPAMVQGLIDFLTAFCRSQGGSVADLYPHFQITRTQCPGASYAKLGLNTGYLDYNYVENSVDSLLKRVVAPAEDPDIVLIRPAVVVFGIWDLVGAYYLAGKLKAPILLRETNWRATGFNKFYILGGPEETGPDIVNITGNDWEGTIKELLEALK